MAMRASDRVGKPGQARDRVRSLGKPLTWMALLAGSTVGVEGVNEVRAEIRSSTGGVSWSEGPCRLVVQAYPAGSFDARALPRHALRPCAAAQRSVSAAELERGVRVQLLQLAERASRGGRAALLAWVEPGLPDLEFDGLTARPGPHAAIGRSFGGSLDGGDDGRIVLEVRRNAGGEGPLGAAAPGHRDRT